MSAPWEKYAAAPAADAGPWQNYSQPQSENPVTITTESPGYFAGKFSPLGGHEALASMASGMVGQAAGGLAGLATGRVTGDYDKAADVSQRVSSALTVSPSTKSGESVLSVAELPSVPIHWASEKLGDKAADVHPLLGTAAKTAVEGAPVLLGARAAMAPKRPLTAAQQKVADARDAGFKMTPEEMGAGIVPRTLASVSGEPRLARGLSKENTATTTAKAKAELGLPAEATLDLDTLTMIRKQEGQAYQAVREAGPITMDAQYLADIDALGAKYKSAAKDFPGLAKPEIEQVIRALKKEDEAFAAAQAQGIKMPTNARQAQAFDANSGVDLIGQLRESADKAFRTGDTGLAKVLRGGAEAVENQIGRHLEATGRNDILPAYQQARERIAKTYAVEKALIGEEVNMQALGKQVQKRKPLTGGLKEAGEQAINFERSSMKPSNMPSGATYADVLMGLANGIRTGGGSFLLDVLTAGARPAARQILGSRLAQGAMDPRTNLSSPALEALGASTIQPQPQRKSR